MKNSLVGNLWLCNALEVQLVESARVRGRLVESVLAGVGG